MFAKRSFTHLMGNLLMLTLIGITILSCELHLETVDSRGNINPEDRYVTMSGLRVRIPANVSQDIFGQKFDKYMAYFDQHVLSKTDPGGRVAAQDKADWGLLTLDEILQEIRRIAAKYPDLRQRPLKSSDLARIRKDFPDLKNEEDIDKYGQVVYDYYSDLIKIEIAPELAKKMKARKGARMALEFGEPNDFENALTAWNPTSGWSVSVARTDATNMVDALFGPNGNGDRHNANAFKHAVWNAMGVQEIITRRGNKWVALDKMRQFATAHELKNINCQSCPTQTFNGSFFNDLGTYFAWNFDSWFVSGSLPTSGSEGDDAAMDLHNNLVGRTYMYQMVRTGLFGIVTYNPSDDAIRDYFKSYVCFHLRQQYASGTLSYYNGNLGSLGGMNYHNDTSSFLIALPTSNPDGSAYIGRTADVSINCN
ncbi:DUF6973 domain-containing protein [Rudanella lutea]|uniref:DUF6973 domain-containing protein n=1 Tax=Rudanella lutea TaxID=451374 RepID=UPI00037E02E5|nr:hypothetical protein [Rudanella lutea]